jgi:hypothetical protein
MYNLCIFENNILVKADKKTQEYLDQWAQQKEEDWKARAQKGHLRLSLNRSLKGEGRDPTSREISDRLARPDKERNC